MIYFCQNYDILSKKPELLRYLPPERLKKLGKLKVVSDKNNSLIAWLLLSCALKQPYLPDFSYHENGKPYFKELPTVDFSISHCKTGVVCAVSDSPIGIDIQDIRSVDFKVMERVCSKTELEFLLASDNRDYEFIKLWTLKESILKQSGIGISGNIKDAIENCNLQTLPTKTYCYEKFIISVCGKF